MRIPVGLLVAAACVAGSPVKDKKGGHGAGKGCTGECAARPTAYTAKPFAKDAFAEYYAGFEPTQTSVQPQPKVTDIVNGRTYPLNLTAPTNNQTLNSIDPIVLPPSTLHPNREAEIFFPGRNFSTAASLASLKTAFDQISSIIKSNGTGSTSTCDLCIQGLKVAQGLAREWPWETPSLLIQLCSTFSPGSAYGSCVENYGISSTGDQITQVLSFANMSSLDGIMICAKRLPKAFCPIPPVSQYNASDYFNTTLPTSVQVPKPSGKRLKVLHLSDFHLDPRYSTGSEAQCSGYLCCQASSRNTSAAPGQIIFPAPRYGAFSCDTPYDLALAALEAIPVLTGTQQSGFDFTIFTGDLVSHLDDNQLSREFVEYEESITFGFFKKYLGGGPTYIALGNHDSWPQALNSLSSLMPKYIANQFGWNYAHVSALWQHYGWVNQDEAEVARTNYGGFSVKTRDGLRIISFNSDNLYTPNLYNYINMTNPDNSGSLRFIAKELQLAEDRGERVWVISHVLAGWDGSAGLKNPTDLLNQILTRYSATIAATFNGHIHDDVLYITYANNGTVQNSATARLANWVGPSITPLTNLNSGFRMYEVDSGSFEILDAYTWYSNTTAYPALDHQTKVGPTYELEYSTREAYGKNITGWGPNDPLNGTWWHKVTEQMEIQPSLVNDFTQHQGRLSTHSKNCTSTACVAAKICYLRSSTNALGQACPKGFSSVQN